MIILLLPPSLAPRFQSLLWIIELPTRKEQDAWITQTEEQESVI